MLMLSHGIVSPALFHCISDVAACVDGALACLYCYHPLSHTPLPRFPLIPVIVSPATLSTMCTTGACWPCP